MLEGYMPFTSQERSDLFYFLGRRDAGYGGLSTQHQELEDAVGRSTFEGEDQVRALICKLRGLEESLCSAMECLTVAEVDGAKFRSPTMVVNVLRSEGRRLVRTLARFLGVHVHMSPFGVVSPGMNTPRG